jgi:general secretion pathway protein M
MMKLSKRERYAVFAAAIFISIFVIVQFIVFPFVEKKERMENALKSKAEVLAEMRVLKSEYETLTNRAGSWEKRVRDREKGFTLFSFLDKLAGETGIKDNIAYMKPSKSEQKDSLYKKSLVEMKLQGINLKQLTPYLHKIETSKNSIFIKRISISKKGEDKEFADAVLQVETFEI